MLRRALARRFDAREQWQRDKGAEQAKMRSMNGWGSINLSPIPMHREGGNVVMETIFEVE
jgi:hypothetical protein